MRLVVTDTGPINYLILIGHIQVLGALFDKVIFPLTVRDELSHPKAPPAVRNWILKPPIWTELHPSPDGHDPSLDALDAGESSAIFLAMHPHADLVLMDDAEGVAVARASRSQPALNLQKALPRPPN